MPVQLIIEPFTSKEWIIKEWSIKFMLSERLLTQTRKQSKQANWYEDSQLITTWSELISRCFHSVEQYHKSFGSMPVVGDRLFNEDTGLLIKDRSIDGDQLSITFTLDS